MEVPGSETGGVTLIIKAPSQRQEDQEVDALLSWTVRKLKQHLETVYPSKPKSNEQRLIYSGKLLQDQFMLKDILKQYDSNCTDNRYTLHLVCSATNDSTATSVANKKDSNAARSSTVAGQVGSSPPPATSVNPPTPAATSTSTPAPASSTDGLRYRGASIPNTTEPQTYAAAPGMYGYPAMGGTYNPYVPTTSGYGQMPGMPFTPGMASMPAMSDPSQFYSQEQYTMMMQQMYSQYMMQYMQYYQAMSANPYMQMHQQPQQQPWSVPTAAPAPAQNAAPDAAAAAAANNNNIPAGGAAAAAGGRPNVRMNAQGGVEEVEDEDDGEPRDWLHHTYFLMRFLTFMGILFFYSNLTRFLIVFSGSFVIYFLQRIRKHYQRQQRQQEQQQRQQQEQQQQQDGQQEQQQQEQPGAADVRGDDPGGHQEDEGAGGDNNARDNNEEANEGGSTGTGPAAENQVNQEVERAAGGRLARTVVFFANTLQAFFTSLLPTPPEWEAN